MAELHTLTPRTLTIALLRLGMAMNRAVYMSPATRRVIGDRLDGAPFHPSWAVTEPENDALHLAALGDGRWQVRTFVLRADDTLHATDEEIPALDAATLEVALGVALWSYESGDNALTADPDELLA